MFDARLIMFQLTWVSARDPDIYKIGGSNKVEAIVFRMGRVPPRITGLNRTPVVIANEYKGPRPSTSSGPGFLSSPRTAINFTVHVARINTRPVVR